MDRNDFEEMPEGLWKQLSKVLPAERQGARRGRPRIENRRVMAGIMFRLRTGCQWKAIPRHLGSGSTCHRRFQQWQQAGVFRAIFAALVGYTDRVCGIEWQWASLDSATVKAPKGGDCTGPNPTDRAKLGVKRHVLTDGRGVPVAIGISAANVHDKRLAEPLMDAVVIRQGRTVHRPQHLCLDKGYDNPTGRQAVVDHAYTPHIRKIGEEKLDEHAEKRYPARRWVV